MGFFDRFRKPVQPEVKKTAKIFVGASGAENERQLQSFDNSNITFSGELSGYDYDSILRDKQSNIVSLYKLADYYVDQDPIIRGIVKHVYVPYATCSKWFLTGTTPKTAALFEEQYKKMRLREKIDDIMLQYFKYNNVFIYIWKGNILTLPVHKCKIGNTTLNGTPIVEFDVQSISTEFKYKSYTVKETSLKDSELDTVLKGYPDEVRAAIKEGKQYAQLKAENCYVMQGSKEGWMRYAVPFIASCLYPLAKKELISSYETSLLNLGIRSFVHTTYGDSTKGMDILPDREQLTQVKSIMSQAMSGFPLAVTNHLAKAQVVQPDMSDLFQFDKYRQVNNDLLAAGGISGIIVNGDTQDGSTFASAQVSVQAAAARIEAARREFCELMNKVNERLVEDMKVTNTYNLKKIPEFHFEPLSMEGEKTLRETCKELWQQGIVSTQTLLEKNGYDLSQEKTRRQSEKTDGVDELLVPRTGNNGAAAQDSGSTDSNKTNKGGRPEMSNEERNSDPENAARGKQPKPSNPEGSMKDDGIS